MKRFLRVGGGEKWEDPSLAEWDPNDFRVFCGDLGNEVSDELLAKAFRKYPSFQRAKVVRDNRTNKSKGYGFVSFRSQDVSFIHLLSINKGLCFYFRILFELVAKWMENMLEIVQLN